MLSIGHHQSVPRLQIPGQGCHHHIRPVTIEIVYRHPHSVDSVLQLLNHVLLVAALIGVLDYFIAGQITPIADIEEILDLIKKHGLSSFDTQILAQHDHPVTLLTFPRLVFKLRYLLTLQTLIEKSPLAHNLLFHVLRTLSRLGLDLRFHPRQTVPLRLRKAWRHPHWLGMAILPKMECHPRFTHWSNFQVSEKS